LGRLGIHLQGVAVEVRLGAGGRAGDFQRANRRLGDILTAAATDGGRDHNQQGVEKGIVAEGQHSENPQWSAL
jgi:hypothetical protein